jgi:hypothetical protein
MKIRLGKTAKTHKGVHLRADTRFGSGTEPGVNVHATQLVERETQWGTTEVRYKDVALELDLDEATKLATDLIAAVKKVKGRARSAELARKGECDHRCIHCGHEWTGKLNELCPALLTNGHPTGTDNLTHIELSTLDWNGYTWIEEGNRGDKLRTDAYNRDVLNSLRTRGLIEWVTEGDLQAYWRPTSLGIATIHKHRELRRKEGQTNG